MSLKTFVLQLKTPALLLVLFGFVFCSGHRVQAADCSEQVYPHDPLAFTQGLLFADGILYESTGRYGGHSSVRRVELTTGKVLQMQSLSDDLFGEGLALHQGVLYQLTWHNGIVIKYAPDTLEELGRIRIAGEAWGLASDGERLVMSDGSAVLRYVDPDDFQETGRIQVRDAQGRPVKHLNELEFVEGHIFANIYPTNRVVIIDPDSGRVINSFNLDQLARDGSSGPRACLPNGIAYHPDRKCLLVTGKYCNRLLQLNLPH